MKNDLFKTVNLIFLLNLAYGLFMISYIAKIVYNKHTIFHAVVVFLLPLTFIVKIASGILLFNHSIETTNALFGAFYTVVMILNVLFIPIYWYQNRIEKKDDID